MSIAVSRMLFVTSTLIWALLPAKAEVLTLSCDGTMKTEQEQPHAITKMGLIVNFDARIVTGVSQKLPHALMRSTPNRFPSGAPLPILLGRNGQSMAP
jgi:hypothetical protein